MARFGMYQIEEHKKRKTRAVLRRQSKDKRYRFGACGRHTSNYLNGLRIASWRIYTKSVKPLVLKAMSDIVDVIYPSKEKSVLSEVQTLRETIRDQEERIRKLENRRHGVQLVQQGSVETHTLRSGINKTVRQNEHNNLSNALQAGQDVLALEPLAQRAGTAADSQSTTRTKRAFEAQDLQRGAKKLRPGNSNGSDRTQAADEPPSSDHTSQPRPTAINTNALLGAKAKLKSKEKDNNPREDTKNPATKPSPATGITPNALLGAKAKLRGKSVAEQPKTRNEESSENTPRKSHQGISANLLSATKAKLRPSNSTGEDQKSQISSTKELSYPKTHNEESSENTPRKSHQGISANLLSAAKAKLRPSNSAGEDKKSQISSTKEFPGHSESPKNLITSRALFSAKGQLRKVKEAPKQEPSEEIGQGNFGNGLLHQVLQSSMIKRFQESGVSDATAGSSLVFTKQPNKENVNQPSSDPNYKTNRRVAFNNRTNSPRPLQLNDASLNGIKSGLRSTPNKRSPGGTPMKNNSSTSAKSPLTPAQNTSDKNPSRGSCHGDFLRSALAKRFAAIHGEKDSPASSTDSDGSTTPLRRQVL